MTQESSSIGKSTEQSAETPPETGLDTARHQLNKAASYIDVDPNIVERLNYPAAVHEVTIPLERDDGTVEMLQGYRVQHDSVPDGVVVQGNPATVVKELNAD